MGIGEDKDRYRRASWRSRSSLSEERPSAGGSVEPAPREGWSLATVGTTVVAGATVIPYFSTVNTVPSLVISVLRLLAFVVGIYWCVRGLRAAQGASTIWIWASFLLGGTVLMCVSFLGGRVNLQPEGEVSQRPSPPAVSNGSAGNAGVDGRTFRSLWQPALERKSISDGSVARSIDGMELQAKNCGAASVKSYQLVDMKAGDQLAFDIQNVSQGDARGDYRVHVHGAGVSEAFNLTGNDAEHVSVEVKEVGDIAVDVTALHRAEENCRDSKEFLAVQSGMID